MKLIGRLISFIIVILLVVLIFPFTPNTNKNKLNDYSNILGNNLNNGNALVTDIAMLGAHDAFSSDINFSSPSNVNEGGLVNNKIVKILARGLMVRLSKAQNVSALDLLNSGVRYLDVRVTKIDNVYYTHHGMISNTLEYYVKDVVEFLKNHPKEFVVFDIQHFESDKELNNTEYKGLFDYLTTLGLFEYVNYSSSMANLDTLTYNQVTNNRSKGGVIILAKNNSGDERIFIRDGNAIRDNKPNNTIRSYWHDTNDINKLLENIETEYEYIKNNKSMYSHVFKVNQAVITAMQSNKTLIKSILGWSLLNMANNANAKFIEDEARFNKWISIMPIFMVDFSTSSKDNFNNKVNDLIATYNSTL